MIEDFDDRHLIRAAHGLREFVVIDEDELARNMP